MADFREVVNRQLRARVHGFHGSADARATFSHPNLTMIVTATDHERRVAVYPLSADDRERAESVLMRYRARVRPGDAERSALLAQLVGVLHDEERTDLWAALQRRPLVQEGAPFGVSAAAVGIPSHAFVRLLDQLRQR
jgi:hypothetical protein